MTRSILRAAALAALMTCQSVAQDMVRYEAVLVPFHSRYETAGGTVGTEVWIRNEGDTPVAMFPAHTISFPAPCLIGSRTIRPHSTLYTLSDLLGEYRPFVPPQTNQPPGAFLWFERNGIRNLTTTALLTLNPFPTAYPLVRHDDFRTGTASIPSVQYRADARYMIRVYGDVDAPEGSSIHVNIYDREPRGTRPEVLRKTEVLTLHRPLESFPAQCVSAVFPEVPMKPVYAQTADLPAPYPAVWPAWRIEFAPSDPTLRYWAVVSATKNATNAITLYTISN